MSRQYVFCRTRSLEWPQDWINERAIVKGRTFHWEAMSTVIKSRHASRLRTFKGGLIIFALAPPVNCLIRNLSETGAVLDVERPGDIPDEFSLLIKPEFVKRNCRVAWRSAKHIGIQFVRGRQLGGITPVLGAA